MILRAFRFWQQSERARQTVVLYAALMASLVLGIGVSVVNTRLLGPETFGELKLLQNIWTLIAVVGSFGFSTSAGDMLTRTDSSIEKRRIVGSLVLVGLVIGALLSAASFGLATPIRASLGGNVGHYVRHFAGFVIVFSLQIFAQDVFRGLNAIGRLSILTFTPQLFYLAMIAPAAASGSMSLGQAVQAYLLSVGLTSSVLLLTLKPATSQLRPTLKKLARRDLDMGLHVYAAVLTTTAAAQSSQYFLAHFSSAESVGIFSLALTLTAPLGMIPNSIATVFFRRFATSAFIPRRVLFLTVATSAVALLSFAAVARPIIKALYPTGFASSAALAMFCAMGVVLRGLGDFYNRFLLAKSLARPLRNNSFVLGGANIAISAISVCLLGVWGAVAAKLVIDVLYLTSMYHLYSVNSQPPCVD